MSATRVVRPVVRSFRARFEANAAEWVKRGGHAIVWDDDRRARLVVSCPRDGDEDNDLGYWSMLDLGKDSWSIPADGALEGLAVVKVPRDCLHVVKRRAERDSILPGPKRVLFLDCLACAACCKDNEVILMEADVARFSGAGRGDLAQRPYAKRVDGKVVLVLQRDKRCKHLGGDNKCGIYPIRPWACSAFPAGSECCLFSRESELGVYDGLAPEA